MLSLSYLADIFWDHQVWCPRGTNWSDFKQNTAQFGDLKYSIVTAFALIAIRYVLEQILFRPIGRILCKSNKHGKLVEPKPSTVKKFGEGLWRISFYSLASLFGWFYVLWDKPYRDDTFLTLVDVHKHTVHPEEWWYYNIELGFYLALIISQFTDTKRKDFWQMFVHHIVTVLLLTLSWASHYHRIGCLVLAIHDVADVPLEGAKLAKYANKQNIADIVFGIFALVWIYTRCYMLPKRVIYYTAYAGLEKVEMYPAYYIFNSLLCALQVLHIVWTYIILNVAVDALKNNGMRDLRSDSEESHSD